MIHVQINKSDQLSEMGNSFKNSTNQRLSEYLLDFGIVPDFSLYKKDDGYNHYYMNEIDSKFLLFIDIFRTSFKFEAHGQESLGFIKDVKESELDTLVPDNFPDTLGRSFRDYFPQPFEIEGVAYYHMHTYTGWNETDLRYTSRPLPPSDIDFWAFYDYFGIDRVILSQYLPKQINVIL